MLEQLTFQLTWRRNGGAFEKLGGGGGKAGNHHRGLASKGGHGKDDANDAGNATMEKAKICISTKGNM